MELREITASNCFVPVSILETLTTDAKEEVRGSACQNKTLPLDHPNVLEAYDSTDRFSDPRLSEQTIYDLIVRFRKRIVPGMSAERGKVSGLLQTISRRKLGALHP